MLDILPARFRVGSIKIQFNVNDSFSCDNVVWSAPARSSTFKSMDREIPGMGLDPGLLQVGFSFNSIRNADVRKSVVVSVNWTVE